MSEEMRERQIAAFWERVRAPDGCLLYYGAKEANGYGYVANPLPDGPKFIGAHRLAWILKVGPIPEGMQVLHKCDMRACCNVEHLYLGTASENMTDMLRKRRSAWAQLNPDQVREVRRLLPVMSQTAIARKIGVKLGVVHDIAHNGTYQWVE